MNCTNNDDKQVMILSKRAQKRENVANSLLDQNGEMESWKPELVKYGDAVGLRLGDGPGRRLKEFVSKPEKNHIILSRINPIEPLMLLVYHFGPIRDTIK